MKKVVESVSNRCEVKLTDEIQNFISENPEYELYGTPVLVNEGSQTYRHGMQVVNKNKWVQFFKLKNAQDNAKNDAE